MTWQRAFGWALVEVPYWEWQSEWDVGQRSAYLERKISAALSTQLSSSQLSSSQLSSSKHSSRSSSRTPRAAFSLASAAPPLAEPAAAPLVAEPAAAPPLAQPRADDGRVDEMSYRELQRACKAHGLGAVGTADVLRKRLEAAAHSTTH